MKRYVVKEIPSFIKLVKEYGLTKCRPTNFQKEINFSQFQVLNYLIHHQNDEINQTDIQQMMGFRKSSISALLESMEKDGLIERSVSQKDARKKIIKVRKEIIPTDSSMNNHMEKMESVLTANIDQDQLDTFFRVLDQMKANLEIGD